MIYHTLRYVTMMLHHIHIPCHGGVGRDSAMIAGQKLIFLKHHAGFVFRLMTQVVLKKKYSSTVFLQSILSTFQTDL